MMRPITATIPLCILLICTVVSAQNAVPTTEPAIPLLRSMGSKFDLTDKTDSLVAQYDRDPFGRIAGAMGTAADLLADLKTSEPTQPKQQDIVASLDEIIAMLEKQKKNAHAGSNPNPSNPLPDSIIAKGPGGQGNMHDVGTSARLWGQLSPKEREQILQSQNEGFPPGYETILSSYYKRLAQENVEGSPDAVPDSTGPATQP